MWSVIRIPLSELGNVDCQPTGFAVALFGKPITADDIVRLIGPFPEDG